ncbi:MULTISPECIES: helix-turn-helix transcriptional regulator [Priestia]|uniref:helix-turn-helix transcriptional regulator n=1 Tax=Priestia TaxID=2800373 RepID=UPI001F386557|nr:helix-turn-helix domain-containing protein [Priestia megaterium]
MPKKINEDNITLKPRLKMRFLELELQQQDIAEKMNESKQTISLWSTGKKQPTLKKAFKLARILGCTIEDLWDYEED